MFMLRSTLFSGRQTHSSLIDGAAARYLFLFQPHFFEMVVAQTLAFTKQTIRGKSGLLLCSQDHVRLKRGRKQHTIMSTSNVENNLYML